MSGGTFSGRLTAMARSVDGGVSLRDIEPPRPAGPCVPALIDSGGLSHFPGGIGGIADVGYPATFVAEIADARVFAPQFVVGAADGAIFYDCLPAPHRAADFLVRPEGSLPTDYTAAITFPDHILDMPAQTAFPEEPTTRFAAAVALGMPWSENYWHWVVDILPRLGFLDAESAGLPLLVPPLRSAFQRESLALAGIAPDRVVEVASGTVAVDRLIFPSRIHRTGFTSPEAVHWLRETYAAGNRRTGRRVLVSRADATSRRIINEPRLVEALAPAGFEQVVLGRLGFAEQVRLFAEAEIVVAPHGAGFTNIAFAPPGLAVIEVAGRGAPNPAILRLAGVCGHRFAVSIAEPDGGDLVADVEGIRSLVRSALG